MTKPDFNMPISHLELSVSASCALGEQRNQRHRVVAPAIKTLGELVTMRERDLLARPGFARRHLREIKELLASDFGLALGTKIQPHERCIVYGCQNHKDEGTFVGDLCGPCHNFIVTGIGDVAGSSQIYRNAVDRFTLTLSAAIKIVLLKLLDIKDKS
jgi:hypothetical protein